MSPRRALYDPRSAVAAIALVVLAAVGVGGCGGGSDTSATQARTDAASATTASARLDTPIQRVVGTDRTPQQQAAISSEKTRNPGPADELQPLHAEDFTRPVARYRRYSEREAAAVKRYVAGLEADLRGGDVAAAKADWSGAYDHYLRLGAAYGALGKLDEEIDGNPGRLAAGVRSPEFTGLHRIEMGLWGGEPAARLVGPAAYLAAKVDRLQIVVRRIQIPPLVYATRAHEILEDAQRDMLSGVAAPWSGAGLRATADSLAATEFVIGTLRPLLNGRGSTIEPIETELAAFQSDLARVRREHGGEWPSLGSLTRSQHQRVDGGLGSLLGRLAAVPGALEIKRTKPVPTIVEQEEGRNG